MDEIESHQISQYLYFNLHFNLHFGINGYCKSELRPLRKIGILAASDHAAKGILYALEQALYLSVKLEFKTQNDA